MADTKKRAAKKARRKVTTPRAVRTEKALIALPRDNWTYGDYWMLVSESDVSLAHQVHGQPAKAVVRIPKRAFNHFVDIYNGRKPNVR